MPDDDPREASADVPGRTCGIRDGRPLSVSGGIDRGEKLHYPGHQITWLVLSVAYFYLRGCLKPAC